MIYNVITLYNGFTRPPNMEWQKTGFINLWGESQKLRLVLSIGSNSNGVDLILERGRRPILTQEYINSLLHDFIKRNIYYLKYIHIFMRLHVSIYQQQHLKNLCYHLAVTVLTTWNACTKKMFWSGNGVEQMINFNTGPRTTSRNERFLTVAWPAFFWHPIWALA